jgi:hypothetical protein
MGISGWVFEWRPICVVSNGSRAQRAGAKWGEQIEIDPYTSPSCFPRLASFRPQRSMYSPSQSPRRHPFSFSSSVDPLLIRARSAGGVMSLRPVGGRRSLVTLGHYCCRASPRALVRPLLAGSYAFVLFDKSTNSLLVTYVCIAFAASICNGLGQCGWIAYFSDVFSLLSGQGQGAALLEGHCRRMCHLL